MQADFSDGTLMGPGSIKPSSVKRSSAVARMESADFSEANLVASDLSNGNLGQAALRGANLTNANLRGSLLQSALTSRKAQPLYGSRICRRPTCAAQISGMESVGEAGQTLAFRALDVNFRTANLTGAVFDANTQLPFDAREAASRKMVGHRGCEEFCKTNCEE